MKRTWHQQFKRSPAYLRTSPDGIVHHSVEEKERWCKLQFDQNLGLVRNLMRQVAYPLVIDEQRAVRTPKGKVMRYTADFTYQRLEAKNGIEAEWVSVIEEHKGFMDKAAEIRIAIFEAIYQKKVYIHKR